MLRSALLRRAGRQAAAVLQTSHQARVLAQASTVGFSASRLLSSNSASGSGTGGRQTIVVVANNGKAQTTPARPAAQAQTPPKPIPVAAAAPAAANRAATSSPSRSVPNLGTTNSASSDADSFPSSSDLTLSLETGLGASLRHLLTGEQRVLLLAIKAQLGRTRTALKDVAYLSKEDSRWLKIAIQSSEELFLIAVVGEYNAGKSSLLNALLGGNHCPTGVLPTTDTIQILRYGAQPEVLRESANVTSVLLPLPFLREASFVDTPGTNAILRAHELLTTNFLPRADLCLFLTSVDRPFSESERLFMSTIARWKKKVAIVVNKCDMIKREEDLKQILNFVRDHASRVLQDERHLTLFPIAAEQALQAKLQLAQEAGSSTAPPSAASTAASAALASSGLPALEKYIFQTLSAQQKIFLKLSGPLGIGQRIVSKYLARLDQRDEASTVDRALLARLRSDRREFEQTLVKDYTLQDLKLQQLFERVQRESDAFVAENITISNVRKLLDTDGLAKAYQARVYASLPADVEACFSTLFDYATEESGKAVSRMQGSIRTRLDEVVQENAAASATDSRALTEALRESSASTSSLAAHGGAEHGSHSAFVALSKDAAPMTSPMEHGAELASEARQAVVQTAVLQVSSLSLGTAVALNALSFVALAAVPGYFALGGFVTLGLAGVAAMPLVRSRVQRDLRSKTEAHARALRGLFERSVAQQREQALRSMDTQVLRRYERFVQAESAELEAARSTLLELQEQLQELKQRIALVTNVPNEAAIGQEQQDVTPIDQVTPVELLDQAAPAAPATPPAR